MLAGGVVDKRLWYLRKRCFFSCRLLVGVSAGDGMLKDRQLVVVAAGDGMLKDRLLVAVAAGDGMLTDGKHENLDHSADHTGRNDMIPRRLGRVAIISSIGGLRPT